MTAPNAQPTSGIGIVVGELGISASRYSLPGQPEQIVGWDPGYPPPSVLLSRFPHEPLRLNYPELGQPCHPRGSGCDWPPESQVDGQSGSGRFPLALAWTDLPQNQTWAWAIDDYHEPPAVPAEAIATAAANILQLHPSLQGDGNPALIIPNTTREEHQQAILDESRRLEMRVQLLWRPVAAALAWCDKFDSNLRGMLSSRAHQTNESLGHLLCLHLGLAEIEATVLELVLQEHDGDAWIVPARDRSPSRSRRPVPSPGWLALKTSASEFLSAAQLPADRQHLWQLLFATNWANAELFATSAPVTPVFRTLEMPSGAILDIVRPRPISLANLPQRSPNQRWHVLGAHSLPEVHPDSLDGWRSNLKNDLPHTLLGAVVTGEIASVPMGNGQTLAQFLLDGVRMDRPPLAIKGPAESDRLLAHGAAIFSARLAAELPTYLDTLPQLHLFIRRRNGELDWEPLLKPSHEYVDGGREWRRPDPVSGLAIEKNRKKLTFAIDHEEFPNIRELLVELPRPSESDEPVKLHVSITPAQGNARLEVCPTREDIFGTRRIRVDWGRMAIVLDKEGGHDRHAYIAHQPRIYPELHPRFHSRGKWAPTRIVLVRLLEAVGASRRAETRRLIEDLKNKLRTLDQLQYPFEFRAVGSDGRVDDDQELLDRTIDQLCARLKWDKEPREASHIIRCLAYASADRPAYANSLIHKLSEIMGRVTPGQAGARRTQRSLKQAVLLGCGHCLRTPEHTKILARHLVAHFESGPKDSLYWLQSLESVLRYRKDASRYFDAKDCTAILEICRTLLQGELNRANDNQNPRRLIFKHAALVVAFLLRRRAFDPDFLDPASSLAQEIKKTCVQVIEAHEQGRFPIIGGAIDVRKALQQIIDYIDRRGIGGLVEGGLAAPDAEE